MEAWRRARLLLPLAMLWGGCSRSGAPLPGQPPLPRALPQVGPGDGRPLRDGERVHRLWLPSELDGGMRFELLPEPGPGPVGPLLVSAEALFGELATPCAALHQKLGPGASLSVLASAGSKGYRALRFYPVTEQEWDEWLDREPPGLKLRVIYRTDGMEVVGSSGKVPGQDRRGPSLPPVEGRPDLAGLRKVLSRLKVRWPDESEAALVPSGGVSLGWLVQVLAAMQADEQGLLYEKVLLVCPRP